MSKQAYIQQAVNWVKSRGFNNIRANAEGYPTPGGYGRQQDGQSFIPDVTANQFEQKSYFEVVLKNSPMDELVSKLKLLHQLSMLHGGQLYLLAPKGHLPFAKSIAAQSGITAELITLN